MKTNIKASIYLIVIVILFIIITLLALLFYKNKKENDVKKTRVNSDNLSLNYKLKEFEKLSYKTLEEVCKESNIKNKICLIKNSNLYIGDSKKEIENNFYDVLVSVKGDTLNYEIIKLWKTVDDIGLLNKEYLFEILTLTCKACTNKNILNKLLEIIEDYYTKHICKELEPNTIYTEKINSDVYNLNVAVTQEDNVLKIIIKWSE